jgi:hypothetical protein
MPDDSMKMNFPCRHSGVLLNPADITLLCQSRSRSSNFGQLAAWLAPRCDQRLQRAVRSGPHPELRQVDLFMFNFSQLTQSQAE